jgi:hypothetical protein
MEMLGAEQWGDKDEKNRPSRSSRSPFLTNSLLPRGEDGVKVREQQGGRLHV